MNQYPAVLQFSSKENVDRRIDNFLDLVYPYIKSHKYTLPELKAHLHRPFGGFGGMWPNYFEGDEKCFEDLSSLNLEIRLSGIKQIPLGIEKVQLRVNELVKQFSELEIFSGNFGGATNNLFKMEKISIHASRQNLHHDTFLIEIISSPYTALDKKTMQGGHDQYLLANGDRTDELQKGIAIPTFFQVIPNGIQICSYRRVTNV